VLKETKQKHYASISKQNLGTGYEKSRGIMDEEIERRRKGRNPEQTL